MKEPKNCETTMTIIQGNLWDELGHADLILFTANNTLDKNGHLVMGAGAALEAKELFPDAPARFGHLLNGGTPNYGVAILGYADFHLGAFQTKIHWRDPSPLSLIEYSVNKLIHCADRFRRIALNFPGTGCGLVSESVVMPIIQKLPDNVFIYQK